MRYMADLVSNTDVKFQSGKRNTRFSGIRPRFLFLNLKKKKVPDYVKAQY